MALPFKLMLLVARLLQSKLLKAPCVSLTVVWWPSGIRNADLLFDDYVVLSFVDLGWEPCGRILMTCFQGT